MKNVFSLAAAVGIIIASWALGHNTLRLETIRLQAELAEMTRRWESCRVTIRRYQEELQYVDEQLAQQIAKGGGE